MSTTREYFRNEARGILERLEETVRGSSDGFVDAEGLRTHGRALRGSAQLAREERVRDLAHALEVAGRAVGAGLIGWTADLKECALETLEEVQRLADDDPEEPSGDARVAELLRRWRALGIEPPIRTGGASPGAAAEAPVPDPVPSAQVDAPAPADFLRFVATELAGILSTLEAAVPALARDPHDREPLKSILRRQRVLFGAAQLERVPPVAEVLRTIDEITRLIARLDAAVTGYWLDVYRSARDVLAAVVGPLDRGEDPPVPDAAMQRLRTLRDRLVEREGGAAPSGLAAAQGDELPVEVVNFFRTEAEALVNRIDHMIGGRVGMPQPEVRDAFTALRDIARTFGFVRTAELVDRALADIEERSGADVPAILSELRATVAQEVPGESVPAASPQPGSSDPAAGTADVRSEAGAVEPLAPAEIVEPAPVDPVQPSPAAAFPLDPHLVVETTAVGSAEPGARIEASPAEAAPSGAIPAPESVADDVVEIETLLYRGEPALRRALELRPELERAITDPSARDVLDEVFDLIRLGMS